MAWWEILILFFLAGGAAALSKCLYSGGITHCTGCGQCAKSGRCVYHAARLEKKRESGRKSSAESVNKSAWGYVK